MTSSQLEACGGSGERRAQQLRADRAVVGIGSPARPRASRSRRGASAAPSAQPSLRKLTEPGSGIARPGLENGEPVSYGNALAETVVGASGSLCSRKSLHARRPPARAEPLFERLERERRAHLARRRPCRRCRRSATPRRSRRSASTSAASLPSAGVLGGHLVRVRARRFADVGVDPGDEFLDVVRRPVRLRRRRASGAFSSCDSRSASVYGAISHCVSVHRAVAVEPPTNERQFRAAPRGAARRSGTGGPRRRRSRRRTSRPPRVLAVDVRARRRTCRARS